MLIYKLFRPAEWADLARMGTTPGAPIDVTDGYVHFSTAAQAAGTVARYFAEVAQVELVAVQADGLGDALRWEPSRGGDLFPHLYRDLTLADVVWHRTLPPGNALPDLA